MVALAQVIKEEESAIRALPDRVPALTETWQSQRTTDREAKFMNLLHGFRQWRQVCDASRDCVATISLENRVISIQRRILSVVISRTVKLICTRQNRRANDRPRGPPYFCRRNTGGHLELGDRIRIWKHANGPKLWLVIVDSVEREVIICGALTVDY